MAGYPIGFFYVYKVAGVYQSQADIDASPKKHWLPLPPGDLKSPMWTGRKYSEDRTNDR